MRLNTHPYCLIWLSLPSLLLLRHGYCSMLTTLGGEEERWTGRAQNRLNAGTGVPVLDHGHSSAPSILSFYQESVHGYCFHDCLPDLPDRLSGSRLLCHTRMAQEDAEYLSQSDPWFRTSGDLTPGCFTSLRTAGKRYRQPCKSGVTGKKPWRQVGHISSCICLSARAACPFWLQRRQSQIQERHQFKTRRPDCHD